MPSVQKLDRQHCPQVLATTAASTAATITTLPTSPWPHVTLSFSAGGGLETPCSQWHSQWYPCPNLPLVLREAAVDAEPLSWGCSHPASWLFPVSFPLFPRTQVPASSCTMCGDSRHALSPVSQDNWHSLPLHWDFGTADRGPALS